MAMRARSFETTPLLCGAHRITVSHRTLNPQVFISEPRPNQNDWAPIVILGPEDIESGVR
jgi:hypothetical protein